MQDFIYLQLEITVSFFKEAKHVYTTVYFKFGTVMEKFFSTVYVVLFLNKL